MTTTAHRKTLQDLLGLTFSSKLEHAISDGSLFYLHDIIRREEVEKAPSSRSSELQVAKQIEVRWMQIEEEYGEGALFVEEAPIIQLCLKFPGPECRFVRKPFLLGNARRLRLAKGPEWWSREHHLDSLVAAL